MGQINWLAFEGEERSAARLINDNLGSLQWHIRLFRDALALADYCDDQRRQNWGSSDPERWQFMPWISLALRDGAITIYNFAECKQAIEKLIGRCPSFKDKLDRTAYSEAGRIWEKMFPGYAHVRLNVAHSGSLSNTPSKIGRHVVPGTGLAIRTLVNDRTMTTPLDGKMASYSLTEQSAFALEAVKAAIYRGYAPIFEFTAGLPLLPDSEIETPPAED